MSPLRALQYSSALDTYLPAKIIESGTNPIDLYKEIKKKDSEILKLKKTLIDNSFRKNPIQEVGKNISYSHASLTPSGSPTRFNNKNPGGVYYGSIILPNPRFSGFNPITGEDRYSCRSVSPLQDIGKRFINNNGTSRPYFS